MSELLSVGLDVGTTSTQLIVSRLRVENRAPGFAVPELQITDRKILYKSPIHFTPLSGGTLVDGDALRRLVGEEYRSAGITREMVDTGAVIVTGETSRKENAATVLSALSDLAGDFVVATAGPDLESVLAARGAGAPALSEKTSKAVLHLDIGGGTTNLALLRRGKIEATGCLNIGGRLVKTDENGIITAVSPVLKELFPQTPGQRLEPDRERELVQTMTRALEMAAGLREKTGLLELFQTEEAGRPWEPPREQVVLSFSGGVAACVAREEPDRRFGDLGPALGRAIRESDLCRGEHVLSNDPIRATVIGAGCHATQLSGSTVFCRNVPLPLKNLPVVPLEVPCTPGRQEGPVMLCLSGQDNPTYDRVTALADALVPRAGDGVYVCLEQDMAKALGQALALRLPPETPILCLDRVRAGEGTYLDIAPPVGQAYPVVIKTLVLGR